MKMKLNQLLLLVTTLLSFQVGFAQWKLNDTTPVVVSGAENFQAAVLYSIDDEGNSYYIWSDYRKGIIELYVQKLDTKGVPQWTKDGVRVGKIIDKYQIIYTHRLIKPDGKGGAFVTWHVIPDSEKQETRQLYAQYISSDGKPLWAEGGIKVTEQAITTIDPYDDVADLIDLKNNKLLVFFNSYNSGNSTNTIYTKKLDYTGKTIETEVKLFENKRLENKVIYDEKNNRFIALIKDNAADYLFQTFDATNKPLIANPVAIYQNPFSGNSRIDLLKVDAEGNAVIGRTLSGNDKKLVYAHKIDIEGKPKWGANGVNLGSDHTFDVQIVPTSDGGGIATWIETADKQKPFQIAKLKANGDILWKNDVFVPKSDKPYFLPNKLVPDGKDGAYTLWLKPKDIGYDLTVQRIDNNGVHRFGDDGIAIKDYTFYSDYRLIPYPNGGVIVFWGANKEVEDGRGGSVDLYTNYITETGRFGFDALPTIDIAATTPNAFCAGQSFSVTFTTNGSNFNLDNNFRILLSDKNGSFDKAIEIGKDVRKTVNVKTTQDLEKGKYKIKVVSTSPVVESQNTIDIVIGDAEVPKIAVDKTMGCSGEVFTFSTSSCQNGVVKWSNNTEGLKLATTVETNTTFTAVCTIPGCKVSEASNAIIIQPIKVAAVANNSGPFSIGEVVKLSSSGGTKYEWKGPNAFVSTEQNATILNATINMGGVYTVTVTDVNNCSGTAQTTVQINNILGIEKEEVHILTFPNPTSHEIIVEFTALPNKQISITLVDMRGVTMGERKVKALGGIQQEVVDVRYMPRGQYLVKVSTSTQDFIKKVIIEN